MAEVKRLASCTFQSTLPREERHNYIRTNLPRRKFQSTLPREERLAALKLVQEGKEISIHAPTRGATDTPALRDKINEFQSTLPREERPTSAATIRHIGIISIHAPTRGATARAFISLWIIAFQSTLPREERRKLTSFIKYFTFNFNPRSHERSDTTAPGSSAPNPLFQSTLPREERPICRPRRRKQSYFNPRSHERSDGSFPGMRLCNHISIHAPTRGATAILHKKFVYFYTIPTINI